MYLVHTWLLSPSIISRIEKVPVVQRDHYTKEMKPLNVNYSIQIRPDHITIISTIRKPTAMAFIVTFNWSVYRSVDGLNRCDGGIMGNSDDAVAVQSWTLLLVHANTKVQIHKFVSENGGTHGRGYSSALQSSEALLSRCSAPCTLHYVGVQLLCRGPVSLLC